MGILHPVTRTNLLAIAPQPPPIQICWPSHPNLHPSVQPQPVQIGQPLYPNLHLWAKNVICLPPFKATIQESIKRIQLCLCVFALSVHGNAISGMTRSHARPPRLGLKERVLLLDSYPQSTPSIPSKSLFNHRTKCILIIFFGTLWFHIHLCKWSVVFHVYYRHVFCHGNDVFRYAANSEAACEQPTGKSSSCWF